MTNTNTMVDYFKACDARNAVRCTDAERARCAELSEKARTVGLRGAERLEWMGLVQRGGQRA